MPRDTPALRVRVTTGGILRPADAYSEQCLTGYAVDSEIEIDVKPGKTYWKRRRYRQILGLVIKQCGVPQKSPEELHQVLTVACGITVVTVDQFGGEVIYPGSTKELTDPEFDEFYEGAMAWLFEMTGVDPDTLEKETSFEPEAGFDPDYEPPGDLLESPPHPARPEPGVDGGVEGSAVAPPIVGEGVASEFEQSTAAALKQEAIHKLLTLANDVKAIPAPADRLTELRKQRPSWDRYLSGHPDFVRHCFSTAEKVIRAELPLAAAQRFLFSMKDG